jgi:ferredoxin
VLGPDPRLGAIAFIREEEVRIQVDKSLCQGHARCNAVAPEVYPLDDLGYTNLDGEVEVSDELAEAAVRGARSCPEMVITIRQAQVQN